MKKVLHYKTNFLNKSETFIDRLVRNHKKYRPIALCYRKKDFTENLKVFEAPRNGIEAWINFAAFHGNLPLPYYKKILETEKPDIVHAHFGYDAVKLMNLTVAHHIPLIVSFYGSDVSRLPSEFGWKRRYKKLAANGDHFIAATSFMKSQLVDLGFPEKKISIIRFGVDLNGHPFKRSSSSHQKLMMVGRMVEKKGFEFAIRALYKLKKRGYTPQLNIYGYGPKLKVLKKLTSDLNLNDLVQFHGYQPVDVILQAHNDHTILLAPSVTAKDGDMEGLPNTILEAMAKGTLVIATKHAAIPEVINHRETGFLVEERDTEGLTNILETILKQNLDLDAIRINARNVIEKDYGIQRMIEEVERIYDQMIHENN